MVQIKNFKTYVFFKHLQFFSIFFLAGRFFCFWLFSFHRHFWQKKEKSKAQYR